METRKKIEIIAAAIVLVVFIVALVLFLRKPAEEIAVGEDEADIQLETSPDRAARADEVEPADIPKDSTVSANTIARTFVERFGSFSSESDYANIEDISSLATDAFQVELNDIIEQARRNADGAYYGISSIVITTKVVNETDTTMTLQMTAQREEAIDDPSNVNIRYQDIIVDLVKEGDDWLIDGFTWQ
ncbi:MAG: hypothetical protein NUV56_03045 [Candidatus Uhrbacteria bacterium]|nr:hypothetical protein [Candidatus Uhrbacteria bacterium]